MSLVDSRRAETGTGYTQFTNEAAEPENRPARRADTQHVSTDRQQRTGTLRLTHSARRVPAIQRDSTGRDCAAQGTSGSSSGDSFCLSPSSRETCTPKTELSRLTTTSTFRDRVFPFRARGRDRRDTFRQRCFLLNARKLQHEHMLQTPGSPHARTISSHHQVCTGLLRLALRDSLYIDDSGQETRTLPQNQERYRQIVMLIS